jgi:hypothetical protein
MGTWSISGDEVTWVTLAAAEIENVSLVYRANGMDELSFDVPGDMLADELFAFGSPIALRYDTTIRFRGRMNTLPRQGVGSQEYVSYRAVAGWWWLDQITYAQQWQTMRTTDNELVSAPKPRIIIGQTDAGERRSLSAEIEAVVDYAIARGAPIAKGTIDAGPIAPFSEHMNMRCSEVIMQCMRFMPDRLCYFDHSTSPYPTFNCRLISSLTAANVDIENVDAENVALTPRYDINVPGIRITYEQSHSYDGRDYESQTVDAAGDTDDARCVDLLFELAGSAATFMKQKVVVGAYPEAPYTDKAFWKGAFSWLEKVADDDLTIDSVNRSGEEDYTSFLQDGSLQEWMSGVAFEDEVWTVKVSYVRRNDDGAALETVESKEMKITLRSTNATSREYRRLSSFAAAEAIPSGVATALFNSWSHLHWAGSVVVTEAEASFSVGPWRKLNLINGLSAWATMGAAVQEVVIDLDRGTSRLKTGPSGVLEAEALISLFRACHARRFAWRAASRTTALVSGSESAGAEAVQREKPSEGDPGAFKQLRVAASAGALLHVANTDPASVVFATPGDAVDQAVQLREMWIPQLNGASPDNQLVYKLRQVMAGEAYHTDQLVGALIRIRELLDVQVTSATAGDVLRWDSGAGKWINSALPAGVIDLSSYKLGYTVSGGTITLRAGKLKQHGKQHLTVSQATFALGGRQFFYVHHVRSTTTAAWAVAGAEPGLSTTDLDVVFYEFLNGSLAEIHRPGGNIDLDLPL